MQNALRDWTEHYIRNKDIMQKRLVGLDVRDSEILCRYRTGEGIYIIAPVLGEEAIAKITESEVCVVCLNKKENLIFLTKNWDRLSQHRRLSLIFVNPEQNERWIIFPYTHNMITEKPALKRGLESLFSSVQEVHG